MISHNLIAHRGWQHRYPENTAIAIEQAIAIGARYVEVDIQLSADGVPYLSHDDALGRLCNKALSITCLTAEQTNALTVYEPGRFGDQFLGTTFCSLAQCVQLLSAHPQVTLFAEIKEESITAFGIEHCLHLIMQQLEPIRSRCVIISFNIAILQQAQQARWNRIGAVLSSWQQAFSHSITSLSPEILFCDVDLLSQNRLPSDLPFATAIYEIDTHEEACLLISNGAKLIETFCIGEIVEQDTHY